MPTENMLDALGLDALTGFSEQTWAEFLLGLAQHSGEINRFFGRHEDAHWNTLTIGQVKGDNVKGCGKKSGNCRSWVTIICFSSGYTYTLCFSSTLPVVLSPLASLSCQSLR
jgi:hypothetical protein